MVIRDFLYLGKTLKDNHKLITISILYFQNIIKMRFYPFEKFIFFNLLILLLLLLLLLLLGWTRPSHPGWVETGSVQLNRAGLIVGPTSFFSFFFYYI